MNKTPRLSRVVYVFSSLLVTALSGSSAVAATGFDSLSFKPASDHGYYLTVEQSQTLGQWGYALGLTGELSSRSLVLKDAAGTKIQDVIRKQVSADFGAAVGFLDWLNMGVVVSGVPWQQFVTPGTLASDDGARMGDVMVNFKARLLNNEKAPIGIALVPFVTLPTGNEQHFVGNGKVTGGGLAVLDTKRFADRVSFSVNAGAQIRDEVALSPGTTINDQFLYGAGVNVAVAKPVQLIAEADGWTTFDDFFGANSRNLELDGGIRVLPGEKRNFQVTAGGGVGLMDGAGAPDWRVFTTVAYRHPKGEEAPPPPEPLPEIKEEVITTNKIHFAFNKYVIKPASYPIIQEILNGIQGRADVEGVRVEGHTDSIGSDAYNQKLSDQRANSVRTFLIDHGYPAEKVTAVGMGETSPIADNATKEGRAQNRRVEFHLQVRPGAKVKVKQEQTPSPTFEEGDPGTQGGKRRVK
jgi:outer membrane protein OmpA-like peptidoglycan-associated protein